MGPIGPAGASGASGASGSTGIPGKNGSIGPTGPQGADGPQGPTGPQGSSGIASVLSSSGTATLPANGPTSGAFGVLGPVSPSIYVNATSVSQSVFVSASAEVGPSSGYASGSFRPALCYNIGNGWLLFDDEDTSINDVSPPALTANNANGLFSFSRSGYQSLPTGTPAQVAMCGRRAAGSSGSWSNVGLAKTTVVFLGGGSGMPL